MIPCTERRSIARSRAKLSAVRRVDATRSEYAHQLRISLLEHLAPHGRCAECERRHEIEALEVDHIGGRTWYGRQLNFLDRIRRQWRELDDGVPLRALCRRCSASDGSQRRGRARYRR
jgi:hypothetical protein